MSRARPLTSIRRIDNYLRQTGRKCMTRKQERRNRKKNRRGLG